MAQKTTFIKAIINFVLRLPDRLRKSIPYVSSILVAAVFVLLRWYLMDSQWAFFVGSPAKTTYYALSDLSYEDQESTASLRNQIREGILGVVVRGKSSRTLGFQQEFQLLLNTPLEDTILPPELRKILDGMPLDKREELMSTVRTIRDDLNRNMTMSPEQKDDLIWKQIEILEPDPATANLVFQLLLALTEGDNQVDENMTQRIQNMAASEVVPIKKILYAGDTIVSSGEAITPQIARLLREEGYPQGHFPFGALLFSSTAALIAVSWIKKSSSHSELVEGFHQVSSAYLYFLLYLGWMAQLVMIYYNAVGIGMLMIAAIAYLTLPNLMALHLCLSITLSGSVVACGYAVSSFAISCVAGCAVALTGLSMFRKCYSRSQVWFKILLLGVFNIAVASLIRLGLNGSLSWQALVSMACSCLALSAAVMIGLPILEASFDIVSPLQLIELTHPSTPLLRRLQVEAPGTYHHSQMVGNLAEAAGESIGLNTLLLRAGASFHDIGKLRRPQFFIENQLSGINSHDTMSPTLSAMVILSHVKDGMEMADEYHLPTQIKDFIAEHHGTTCLTYFYRKAQMAGLKLLESQFCYPGPRPRSRETGVLMIADSVEAAARAEGRNIKSPDDVIRLVDGVVQSKITSGQLDEVPFTLKDLSDIKKAMCNALRSMYHTREIKPLPAVPASQPAEHTKPAEETQKV